MPKKYKSIVGSSWVDMKLYGESIPHLFHWDLAYLWMIEKESHLRSDTWENRIEAWKYLVGLLLTNDLEIVEQDITNPFLTYTKPYGLTKVSWVRLSGQQNPIGVLSPTVLVRPIPDYKRHDLSNWVQLVRSAEISRPSELSHFVFLAIQRLEEDQQQDSYRKRLAAILRTEFNTDQMANPPRGEYRGLSLLKRVVWSQEPGDSVLEFIEILVHGGTDDGARVYIPRCELCNRPLTRAINSTPIQVTDETFIIECEAENCRHQNQLRLTDFLIWIRNNNEVIVWNKGGIIGQADRGFPPSPTIGGIEVKYEWGPAQLGGETTKRYLRLHFQEKEVRACSTDELFFTKLLVPGKAASFSGLPVRPEWLDAFENANSVKPETDITSQKVVYHGFQIRGLPILINKAFGNLSLEFEENMALGIYPDPVLMPKEWHSYRVFLHGEARNQFEIKIEGATSVLPRLSFVEGHAPSVISIVRGNVGVTYIDNRITRTFTNSTGTDIFLGVDFGTTNTIIYWLPHGESADVPNPDRWGVKPSEFVSVVGWFAEVDNISEADIISDFLPGPKFRNEQSLDRCIIPSVIWKINDKFLIRWKSVAPASGSQRISEFKWDFDNTDHTPDRKAYIEEILFLTIPLIVKKAQLSSLHTKFNLGFAFPLAYSFMSRQSLQRILDDIDSNLHKSYGFSFETFSINESWACVKAFGTPNPGETFLVADMGGGTLDLALFSVLQHQTIEMHQIGSVRFAGETCVKSLAEKKRPNPVAQEEFRWELKDIIASGRCFERYGNDQDAQVIFYRFAGIAFEYIRTIIKAHRFINPDSKINLVLVGNGWHLAEAFSGETQTRGPMSVFHQYYSHLCDQLGLVNLVFYEGEPLPRLPSTKHLVVLGVLRNASGSQKRKELTDEPKASKLPSGCGMTFTTTRNQTVEYQWHDFVGDAIPLIEHTGEELKGGGLRFDLSEMAPLSDKWRSYLLSIFRVSDEAEIPYPSADILRGNIFDSIQGTPPKITKGPLQSILEGLWIEYLKK